MGFRTKEELKQQQKISKSFEERGIRNVGFVTGRGGPAIGAPGLPRSSPLFGKVIAGNISKSQEGIPRGGPTTPFLRTKPGDSIIEGGTTTERRAVSIAESALSPRERRLAKQAEKDRFCKIVIKKGKRVRVCKVKTPKKKTKKAKTKSRPRQNNLFGESFFG